jgi:hypothetical protein
VKSKADAAASDAAAAKSATDASKGATLLTATYGAGSRTSDIKVRVSNALKTGQGFGCNNGTLGDPARGDGKTCVVQYQFGNGIKKTVKVPENGYFDPNIIPFTIDG